MSRSANGCSTSISVAVALFLLGAFVSRGKPFKVSTEFLVALGLAVAFAVPFYDAVSA